MIVMTTIGLTMAHFHHSIDCYRGIPFLDPYLASELEPLMHQMDLLGGKVALLLHILEQADIDLHGCGAVAEKNIRSNTHIITDISHPVDD